MGRSSPLALGPKPVGFLLLRLDLVRRTMRVMEQVLGTQYEFAQSDASDAPAVDFDGLHLPAPLRQQLLQAAEMRNVTEVKNCLDQVQALGTEQAYLAAAGRCCGCSELEL